MDFIQFIESLQQANPNGTIILGSVKMMSKLPNSGTILTTKNITKKSSHPEVPDQQFTVGTNPNALVVRHQTSKLEAGGTNNCITCQFFKPNQLCPKYLEFGKEVLLNAVKVKQFGNGGCHQQKMISVLSDSKGYANKFFELILDKIYDDNIAILSGVDVKYLTAADLSLQLDDED
jgi:hypothetical protein